jgi:CHASE2 domain-containing sensor protein
LKKLEAHQPRAIGLDIYRDFPVEPRHKDLATHLRDNERFIAICKVSGGRQQAAGISPPPEIPAERLGFSDVVRDPDLVLRRHLLALTPDPKSPCKTRYALSLELARLYLKQEGIELNITREGYLQLGTVVFKPMETRTGGYQRLDARGHQVLLNYRSSTKIAQQVTLTKVLSGQLDSDLVRNRIVLIGVNAESIRDHFFTPYSAGQCPLQEVPGVFVQAHMVSQILSAVLDNRPLLWVWPEWGEVLWVWGWSLVGGVGGVLIRQGTSKYRTHSPSGQKKTILRVFGAAWSQFWLLRIGVVAGVALGALYGLCFVLLLRGGWVPLLPPTFALVLTGGSMVVYMRPRYNNSHKQ